MSFHEKFFWYRRREAEAHVSLGAGLVCSGEPALVVPLTSLVSLTLSSRSALELELRLVNEIGHLVTLVFTFSSREDLTSWSVPLGRLLAPAIFVAMPKDIFPIITAFLDVSAWKALRSVSSGMRVVADKELPRMERLIAGAAWVKSLFGFCSFRFISFQLAPTNFWTERSTVRIVADEGEKKNLPDANMIMKHPLFPSLTCFSSWCVGTTARCYRTNDAEVPLRNQGGGGGEEIRMSAFICCSFFSELCGRICRCSGSAQQVFGPIFGSVVFSLRLSANRAQMRDLAQVMRDVLFVCILSSFCFF